MAGTNSRAVTTRWGPTRGTESTPPALKAFPPTCTTFPGRKSPVAPTARQVSRLLVACV
ncbi:hypothetical protein PtA15_14A274 [Puccinia triticina]|uniref:Uncharacterized protein n=1 Tax=Puccinia triticina TaxID=208348 RepID=A0ABY7D4X6_9BASI|nr:uncharacterized protein PtA15_14A274 [Puccinia triticina]WAQ91391.1 hypothetical protein PtA15_14A274 [Puccinia triticina]WAR62190.1 hypothetical protein PtB15_14B284 [Puccinia triticina]